MNSRIRAFSSVCLSSAVIAATAVAPVFADTKRDDGDEPGQALGVQGAILWFVVLPLVITGIISLLVMGPGWISAAKQSAPNGFLDDPTAGELTSSSDAPEITSR